MDSVLAANFKHKNIKELGAFAVDHNCLGYQRRIAQEHGQVELLVGNLKALHSVGGSDMAGLQAAI